jgi:hypothetical protein
LLFVHASSRSSFITGPFTMHFAKFQSYRIT